MPTGAEQGGQKKIEKVTHANSTFRSLIATPENLSIALRPAPSHLVQVEGCPCGVVFSSKSVIVQTYDILMAIVLIGAMLFGALKGFAWQLASIASIVVSYAVAYHYREPFSQNIQAQPPWNRFLAMLILYVVTSFLIWVAFRMISGTIDRMKLKEFDRQIGALFGLGKGAIFCSLITLFAVTLLGEQSQRAITESRSGRWIARLLDQSDAIVPEELAAIVQPYLESAETQLGGEGGASPWLAEASPQWPAALPGSQSDPSSTWPTAQNATTNRPRPTTGDNGAPQWQQATGPAPWQR